MKNQLIWFTLIMSLLWLFCGCKKYNMPPRYDLLSVEIKSNELILHCYADGYKNFSITVNQEDTYTAYCVLKDNFDKEEEVSENKISIDDILERE